MFESKIGIWLERENINQADFLEKCNAAIEATQFSSSKASESDQAWAEILMQVLQGTEYSAFVALMQNMREHVGAIKRAQASTSEAKTSDSSKVSQIRL